MLIIGSHVSFKSSDGLMGSLNEALSYNANTFMFYTGAPQSTQRSPINDMDTIKALNGMKENGILLENIICHAPYIVNLANNLDLDKYKFAQNFLRSEIERCLQMGVTKLVLHPGSATSIPRDEAIDNIVRALNNILMPDDNITVLLETMAGKGTEIGVNLDEIKYIIDHIELKEKIGVCLDTCHLNDQGIDLTKFDEYLDQFDKMIGLNKIGCVHINDSKNPIASHKDRHENFGYGSIGFETLMNVINNPRLDNVPKILETPYIDKDYPPYKFEIEMIRNNKFNQNLFQDILNYYKK